MSVRPNDADLEKAHQLVVEEYRRARTAGGTATSPYTNFLLRQRSLRVQLRQQGRGDFELWELLIKGTDGQPTLIDLRYLAPDVFGDPPDAE